MSLSFGIPSLDELIEIPSRQETVHGSTSFAILGPDGTGKSVLSLHLASRYHFDCMSARVNDKDVERPLVMYVSSDLQYPAAKHIWTTFGLDQPGSRYVPFERTSSSMRRWEHKNKISKYLELSAGLGPPMLPGGDPLPFETLNLRRLLPSLDESRLSANTVGPGNHDLLDFFNEMRLVPEVGFLDLAGYSAGDDWSFVNTLLGKLAERRTRLTSNRPPDLVLIDSVAGFETFVGRLDAYGLEQSRRTRIAQCVRNAGKSCHLGFVVEESKETEHQPEEYVTDVVLRLRRRFSAGTMIRTVEVEKARARSMALGEHQFEILSASGTSTGDWENADRPQSKNAYVQVKHSLSHRSHLVAADAGKGRPNPKSTVASFGIRYLDDLLVEETEGESEQMHSRGLESGTVTALMGDTSTGKSELAEQFLAQGFEELVRLRFGLRALLADGYKKPEEWKEVVHSIARRLRAPLLKGPGEPVPGTNPKVVPRTIDELCHYWNLCLVRSLGKTRRTLRKFYHDDKINDDDAATLCDLGSRSQMFAEFLPIAERDSKKPRARLRELLRRYGTAETYSYVIARRLPGSSEPLADSVFIDRIFSLPHFQHPSLLLTTSDRTAEMLARRFCCLLAGGAAPWATLITDKETRDAEWGSIATMIEEQLVVRRFDIAPVSAASLFHVIQRNVILAHQQLFQLWFPPKQRQRFHGADRIRLVIDDLSALASMCPEVVSDTSFLPFLTFFLEREGITSLLVHSDRIRPDQRPDEGIATRLQTLLRRTIMLWPVPFEGKNRTALTIIPTGDRQRNGLVREMVLVRTEPTALPFPKVLREKPTVTTRFELYSGLDEGKPTPVPLAIYLYSETPAFTKYIEREDQLLRELFVPAPQNKGKVLIPIDADHVNALREFSMLPLDARYDHSIVFQVDSHWVQKIGMASTQKNSALTDQYDYIFDKFDENVNDRVYQDPFGLFNGRRLYRPGDPNNKGRRIDYFVNSHYKSRAIDFPSTNAEARKSAPDRIPFMWDFGFILLRHAAWQSAETWQAAESAESADRRIQYHGSPHFGEQFSTIPSVLNPLTGKGDTPLVVPWRAFLGACQLVARRAEQETGKRTQAFDFAGPFADTVNCLILEMWMSEIKLELANSWAGVTKFDTKLDFLSTPTFDPTAARESRLDLIELLNPIGQDVKTDFKDFRHKWAGDGRTEKSRRKAFRDRLSVGPLALYKVWLLLLESLDLESLFEDKDSTQMLSVKLASDSAVASRHWYKTACECTNELQKNKALQVMPLPVRMPGSYSSRGDWFLASPASSRSESLARHAIDLLSSRRANITRMQMGLGLPVRDILAEPADGELPTALVCRKPNDGGDRTRLPALKYRELCSLCGHSTGEGKSFLWLWRTSIKDYDRLSQPLQKWMSRMLRWTVQYRRRWTGSDWDGGFKAYDALTDGKLGPIKDYPSFEEFGELCDLLRAELEAAGRS